MHISEISHTYITDPGEVLKLNQKVNVKILEVDTARKRIALSIKQTLPMLERRSFTPNTKKPFNTAAPKEVKELPLNDALAALKQKFNK